MMPGKLKRDEIITINNINNCLKKYFPISNDVTQPNKWASGYWLAKTRQQCVQ